MKLWISLLAVGLCILGVSDVEAAKKEIKEGSSVTFNYVLRVDGKVLDSSEGRAPLDFVVGDGKIIPGLEERMMGLKTGDKETIVVEAKDAYGEILQDAIRELPRSQFPEDFTPQAGMVIELKGPQGEVIPAVIWEIKEEVLVLNFNHPLAGKNLEFDVEVVTVD